MSAANRPTSHWPSSMSTTIKSTSSINQTIPLITSQKKLHRPLINNQHTFAHRMAKTRHDVEQLFKLYYSNNIKFDTFQRQMITGTRIPSEQTTAPIQHHLINSSTDVFQSKHCVSREQISPLDIHSISNANEHQVVNNNQTPIKRTVQVRIDNNPAIVQSKSPLPPLREVIPIASSFNSITPENPSSTELNESSLNRSAAVIEDISNDPFEHNHIKKSKSLNSQRPTLSSTILPPIPSASALSLINNRKDLLNLSRSSFSTISSLQPSNRPHIITGTAVIVRERSPSKLALYKQRTKSTTLGSPQSNIKMSSASIQYDKSDFPAYIGARVVSIPSKCSRYVLLTFPQIPIRYHAPTYVERLLLPERFPTLFQNIVYDRNHK